MSELPREWLLKEIGEIGEIVSGGTPSTKNPDYWGEDVPWVTPIDLSGYNEKYIRMGRKGLTKLGLKNSSARLMPKGSVLFSSRAPIGYVAIAQNDLATNQGFKSVVPSALINSVYLYFYFKSIKRMAESFASGTTFKELSGARFSKLPIPVPPKNEQAIIAQNIEGLFSDLDNAIENLKKAQEQLKVYRQAVLKYAFEGKLSGNKSLSREWIWKTIGETCITGSGGTPSRSNDKYFAGNIPWVKSGELDFNIIYNTEEKITQEALKNSSAKLVKNGTLLIALYGATVGKMAFLGVDAATNQAVCFIETPEYLKNKFLYYFLILNRTKLLSQRIGGAQPNISQTIIKNVSCPIPSKLEQSEIVKKIEVRFSVCDFLELTIDENLQKAEALRQSILKQAFEGELTEKWRKEHKDLITGDNSAEALLRKIKSEKEALNNKPRGKNRGLG